MNFYSQASQDRFVAEVFRYKRTGSFLDIGCAGRSISNTLGLEEMGWRGWLVDNSPEAKKDSEGRPSQFFLGDAVTMDLRNLPDKIDYLSLDIDHASLDFLRNFPLNRVRFGVITAEHDSYRFGDELRKPMREIFRAHGYDLICADVSNPDPFEDWWVDGSLSANAEQFRSVGKTPQEIFA